jgi:hypothetical protein
MGGLCDKEMYQEMCKNALLGGLLDIGALLGKLFDRKIKVYLGSFLGPRGH